MHGLKTVESLAVLCARARHTVWTIRFCEASSSANDTQLTDYQKTQWRSSRPRRVIFVHSAASTNMRGSRRQLVLTFGRTSGFLNNIKLFRIDRLGLAPSGKTVA